MKIINDDDSYILPIEESNRIVIETSDYKSNLIECLTSYFFLKKKTKCQIIDNEGSIIKTNDISFIYYPESEATKQLLDFKQKTFLNSSITNIINENPIKFKSMENIRNNIYELLTDNGFYKLRKIFSKGLDSIIDFDVNAFDVSNIIAMISISNDQLTLEEKILATLNLMIYMSKDNPAILYLDHNMSTITKKWLTNISQNIYILIDNNCVFSNVDEYDFLILSNHDHLIKVEESQKNINTLMYMNHPIINKNINFQIKENVELYKQYIEKDSTIFLKLIS